MSQEIYSSGVFERKQFPGMPKLQDAFGVLKAAESGETVGSTVVPFKAIPTLGCHQALPKGNRHQLDAKVKFEKRDLLPLPLSFPQGGAFMSGLSGHTIFLSSVIRLEASFAFLCTDWTWNRT